jgi:membrane-associated protein
VIAPFNAGALAAYFGLAALVGGESAGLPIPGETSLLASSVLASQSKLSISLVIAVAAGAAVAGDNAGYLIGRRGGRWLLVRPGRWQHARRRLLMDGEAFFARHGGKAVFLARWVPGLRLTGAWLAGAARMRWRSFFLWNALGGVAWATTIGLGGYFLGTAASRVVGPAGLALLALLVALAVAVLVLRRWR